VVNHVVLYSESLKCQWYRTKVAHLTVQLLTCHIHVCVSPTVHHNTDNTKFIFFYIIPTNKMHQTLHCTLLLVSSLHDLNWLLFQHINHFHWSRLCSSSDPHHFIQITFYNSHSKGVRPLTTSSSVPFVTITLQGFSIWFLKASKFPLQQIHSLHNSSKLYNSTAASPTLFVDLMKWMLKISSHLLLC
jgi:hypothetical protein